MIQDIVSFDCAKLFKKNRNNPSREFILWCQYLIHNYKFHKKYIHDESPNDHVICSYITILDHLQYEMIVFDINVNITDFLESLVQLSK